MLDEHGIVLDTGRATIDDAVDLVVGAARRAHASTRRRVRGYISDPDGDLWPEGYWRRVIEVPDGR